MRINITMGIFTKKKDANKKASEVDANNADKKTKKVEKTTKVNIEKERQDDKKSMKELYSEGEKPKVIKDKKEGKAGKKKYSEAYRILARPLITEKASDIGVINKYVFEVSKNANKIEIAKAIEEVYGVKPKDVNIIRMKGKKVRYGRTFGKKKDWKKAIITLEKGKVIKIYEGV